MKLKEKKIVILILMVIILSSVVGILFYFYINPSYDRNFSSNVRSNKTSVNNNIHIIYIPLSKVNSYLLSLKKNNDKRNPFISLNDIYIKICLKKSVLPRLKGFLVINNEIKAIIDGKIFSQGDRIGDFILYKIKDNYVILKKGNEKYKLSLYRSKKNVLF